MSNLGVHCCCGMPVPNMVVPPSSPCKVPGERSLATPSVLVVCSACQAL